MNINKMRRSPIIHGPRVKRFTQQEIEDASNPYELPQRWLDRVVKVLGTNKAIVDTWYDHRTQEAVIRWREC